VNRRSAELYLWFKNFARRAFSIVAQYNEAAIRFRVADQHLNPLRGKMMQCVFLQCCIRNAEIVVVYLFRPNGTTVHLRAFVRGRFLCWAR